jgi:hypothetical protein
VSMSLLECYNSAIAYYYSRRVGWSYLNIKVVASATAVEIANSHVQIGHGGGVQ